jgi:hypothetical protein
MKRLDAANDNDAGKQIARTRQIWQSRLGRDLTDDDARQFAYSMTGFFGVVAEWARATATIPSAAIIATVRPDFFISQNCNMSKAA